MTINPVKPSEIITQDRPHRQKPLSDVWKELPRPYSKKIRKITIIGAGAWGTALGQVLAIANHDVTIFGRNKSKIEYYKETRTHPLLGDDVVISEKVKFSSDIQSALMENDFIFLSIPTQFVHKFLLNNRVYFPSDSIIVQTAKGIEISSSKLINHLTQELLPDHNITLLSGPSFASEVVRNKPTAVTLAARTLKIAYKVQTLFHNTSVRPYRTIDIDGVALGGAMKNVLAVAAGYVEGYGLGQSAKASLITRGFAEIIRMSDIFGGQKDTFYGLSGLGDIVLTCNSRESRNYDFGFQCGKANLLGEAINTKPQKTVEGFATLKALLPLLEGKKEDFPIIYTLSLLLEHRKDFPDLLKNLLNRPFKKE